MKQGTRRMRREHLLLLPPILALLLSHDRQLRLLPRPRRFHIHALLLTYSEEVQNFLIDLDTFVVGVDPPCRAPRAGVRLHPKPRKGYFGF